MGDAPATAVPATLLLPARAALGGEAPGLERVLARGDARRLAPGDEAQLARVFDLLPRGLPVAALTRQYDRGDAAHQSWLRADPGHVRADLGTGRLLACGDMQLEPDEVEALLQPLRPLFGDDGCPISAGAPSRWYLMLPRDARLPAFAPPSRVLGDDLYAHLPAGDEGRRWRRLLNEAQVVLHNHPVNAERMRRGRPAVNTLWFWGGGALPDHVRCAHARVASEDVLLAALARAAGVAHAAAPERWEEFPEPVLVDLRRCRDAARFERDWLAPALAALGDGTLRLDFADGLALDYRRRHAWRLWRRRLRPSA